MSEIIGRISKLNHHMTSPIVLKRTLEKMLKVYCQLNFLLIFHLWELLLKLYQDSKFPQQKTFCKKPTQLLLTYFLNSFVTYREGFNLNTGNKNASVVDENPSFSRQSMSSPLYYDCSKNKYYFPSLNVSKSFGTVEYDAHILTKIPFSINLVFKPMIIQELNILHYNCQLERKQLLTILSMSAQNP